MSEHFQPGPHPDADLLSAFAEGVLREHERSACLAHLAECSQCREVVYLAGEPVQVPVADKVSFWKRWLTPIPVLSAAGVVAVVVLSVSLLRLERPGTNAPTAMVAKSLTPEVEEAPTDAPARTTQKPVLRSQGTHDHPRSVSAQVQSRAGDSLGTAQLPPPPLAVPQPESSDALQINGSMSLTPLAQPAAPSPVPQAAASNAALREQSGIAGTVTDPAGAAIPRVAVTVRPRAGAASFNTTSDNAGQFQIAGLQPGQYELKLTAPGFQSATKQVDVQPDHVARADSALTVGSVSETVEVTASSSVRQTEPASVSEKKSGLAASPLIGRMTARNVAPMGEHPLPGKLAAVTTVEKGKVMLAIDSAGALFLSENGGQKWKTVKPMWKGKVVELERVDDTASSGDGGFRLTTDSGARWFSSDGSKWSGEPGRR